MLEAVRRAWGSAPRKLLFWSAGLESGLLALALVNSLRPSAWVPYGSDPWWWLYVVLVIGAVFVATAPGLMAAVWSLLHWARKRSLRAGVSAVACVVLCFVTALASLQAARCGGALAGFDGANPASWFQFLSPGLDMAIQDKTVFYVVPLTAAAVLVTATVGYGAALLAACAGEKKSRLPERGRTALSEASRPEPIGATQPIGSGRPALRAAFPKKRRDARRTNWFWGTNWFSGH